MALLTYDKVLRLLRASVRAESSQYKWATKHKLSPPYISDVLRGRREPGDGILRALGLKKVVRYVKRLGE